MHKHGIPQVYAEENSKSDGVGPVLWLLPKYRTRFRQAWVFGSSTYTEGGVWNYPVKIHRLLGGYETTYGLLNSRIWPCMLFVNKQLHDEGQRILYGANNFYFDGASNASVIPFMQDRSCRARSMIQYLSLGCHMEFDLQENWISACRYVGQNLNIRSLRLRLNTQDNKYSSDRWTFLYERLPWEWPDNPWINSLLLITGLKQLELVMQWGTELGYDCTVAGGLVRHLEEHMPTTKIKNIPSRSQCGATETGAIAYPPDSFF